MSDLTGKRIVILGAGGSGLAAARLACREGASVCIADSGSGGAARASLQGTGIECRFNWRVSELIETWDICVFSPGVPLESEMGRYFRACSAAYVSELEFGAGYCFCPKVAITGTNGKTTTVEMLTHCLQASGHRVVACGNIGLPISAVAMEASQPECLVVEVSSYQLESTGKFVTSGAALLNVTPDHLSRHKTMEAYRDTKLRLLKQVEAGGVCVVRRSLLSEPGMDALAAHHRLLTFSVDANEEADFSLRDGTLCRRDADGGYVCLLPVSSLPYGGNHNYENCLAALALGEALGCDARELASHLVTFSVGDHRMQVVADIDGIRYVNDSKATNVDALIQSLRYFGSQGRDIALIAGGVTKGCDLSLALPCMKGHVKAVYLIGESRHELAEKWGSEITCVECDSLAEAVSGARQCVVGGGMVLLSPGCASQDMFRDYEDRGHCFVELISKQSAYV